MQELIVAIFISIKITTYLNTEKLLTLIKNIFLLFMKNQLSNFAFHRNFKIKIQNKILNNISLQIKYKANISPAPKNDREIIIKNTFPFALVTRLKRILQKYFLNNIFLSTLSNPLPWKHVHIPCITTLPLLIDLIKRWRHQFNSFPSPNSPMGLCLPQDGPQHGSARIVGGLGIVWTRESKGLGIEKGQARVMARHHVGWSTATCTTWKWAKKTLRRKVSEKQISN